MEINNQKPIIVEIKKTRLETLGMIIKGVFKGVFILIILVIIVGAFYQGEMVQKSYKTHYVDWNGADVLPSISKDNVAIIPIFGIIANERISMIDGTSSEVTLQMLDEALKDTTVKAVVLKIDSPGGTVFDSEKIAQKIIEIKRSKKVYALLEGMATSGGYYIAAVCDKIFAYEETLTGSIGVIMEFPNAKELMDKAGVEMISVTSGDMKTIGSPFEEFTDEDMNIFQDLVDESYEKFVEHVATGRNMETKEVKKVADGRIFSGKQAFELGLVDDDKGVNSLISELEANNLGNANLLEFYVSVSPFERMLGPAGKVINRIFPSKNTNGAIMFYK